MKKLLLLFAGLAVVWCAGAKITLPEILGDNMVLQQDTTVNLWGWDDPNKIVKIETSWGEKAVTKSGDDGRWQVMLKTPKGGYEPQTVTIRGSEKLTLRNVLIGEVWFVSGQSNMDMPLGGYWNSDVAGGNEAIACADSQRGKLRYVKVPYSQAYTPQDRVAGKWNEMTTATAPGFTAVGYSFADLLNRALDVPVGVIDSSWGGSIVEAWMPHETLSGFPVVDTTEKTYEATQLHMRPAAMYNAMVHPLTPYTLRGFLWYQGESNIGYHMEEYARLLAGMVAAWRGQWGGGEQMPFFYVEIAPFGYGNNLSAFLREEQCRAQKLIPNSGMVSTNDLVTADEVGNIHPRNKRDVGRRLAFWALNRTYGKTGVACEAMQYREMTVREGKAYVKMDHCMAGFGLMYGMRGFEICGADRVFHPAEAGPVSFEELAVWSPEVSEPVAVRYCFGDFVPGNVINSRGLPLVPFRTDDYPAR